MNMTDYEETRRTFRLAVPPSFNYTRDVVEAWAREQPSKLALVAVDANGEHRRDFTFGDMAAASNRVANMLDGIGTTPGDRAFVMLPRIPEWYELLLGMFRQGTVPMPATVLCTPRDIEYRINRAEATIAVTDPEGAPKIAEVADRCPTLKRLVLVGAPGDAPSPGWDTYADLLAPAAATQPNDRETSAQDPLLIYFTSGTVAYPKMVLHTHASYGIGHELTARFWQDLTGTDLHWTVSDTGWAKAAWGMLFGQWTLGAAVFLWDQRGKMDPSVALHVLEGSGVTTFCAPPTLFRAFVLQDLGSLDLSRVRHSVSAGEPLNPEVIKVWKDATGTTIYDGYGQTETVNVVANFPCLPVKPGSMGRPVPTFDVDVVNDDGERLAAGEEGHIAVRVAEERPVGLMKEYWRDEEATANAFRNGWYSTGDRALRDEDGYLWFVGRNDDVIISSSYRIGPFEVESALVEHPAVAESAVVAKPDIERTSIVKAFVVLAPGHEPSDALAKDLQDHCKRVTAPYKYPREIEFVTELPKTISGKIRRVELREREEQR
jgi:acyl-coenzyme A synthetase/AMP-(fatty) acid ligase